MKLVTFSVAKCSDLRETRDFQMFQDSFRGATVRDTQSPDFSKCTGSFKFVLVSCCLLILLHPVELNAVKHVKTKPVYTGKIFDSTERNVVQLYLLKRNIFPVP